MKKNSNKKVKSFVKNNKTLIIYLSLILIVAFFIFLIVYNFKLTSLEIVKIDEFDAKTSIYMEDYADTDDEGKYIIYAISYLTNVNNTNEAYVNDVIEVINNTFNEKYDEKKIYTLGITPSMLEKGVVLDDGNRTVGGSQQWTLLSSVSGHGSANYTGNTTILSYMTALTRAGTVLIPRVTESANHLPGLNQLLIREYSNTSTNTPSAHWYHIY